MNIEQLFQYGMRNLARAVKIRFSQPPWNSFERRNKLAARALNRGLYGLVLGTAYNHINRNGGIVVE